MPDVKWNCYVEKKFYILEVSKKIWLSLPSIQIESDSSRCLGFFYGYCLDSWTTWTGYMSLAQGNVRTELTAYQTHLNLIKALFHSFMNVKWDVDKVFCLYSEPNRTNMAPKVLDNWSVVYQKKKEFVGLLRNSDL